MARRADDPVQIERDPADLAELRELFEGYRQWLLDHREVTAFDDEILRRGDERFLREIAGLPGEYTPPGGALFLASVGPAAVGCAALRRVSAETAEMKRLFVRSGYRGKSIGRALVSSTLERARELGYDRLVLDTLPRMENAIALYRGMGFSPTAPYWEHPFPGALFFEYLLAAPGAARGDRPPLVSERGTSP